MKKVRQEFADTMVEVGEIDSSVVVMVGDISHGILQTFANKNPGKYYNIGICEPSMVNMAAGLSKVGLTPVVHTIAPFITERAFEQIKLDFGYQNLPINIVSVGGAFDYTQLGCSHHCYTDVSLFSHLKSANVMMAGSAIEFNSLFKQTYKNGGINYYKLTEFPHSCEFDNSEIIFGKGMLINEGKDVTLAVTGSQLENAISASNQMKKEGVSIEILYFHTLKPFDEELLRQSVNKTKNLLTVEELSAHDGLFNLCIKASIGINDLAVSQLAIEDFVYGYGTYQDLQKAAGLAENDILRELNTLSTKKNHYVSTA